MQTKKQRDLIEALQKFYQRPVAKVSLELFFSIAAVLFFAIFAIKPTLLTMSDLLKEIEDKKKLDQQFSQKIAALSSIQPTYLQLQNRLVIIDEAIPGTPQLVYSLKIIEKIASEIGLVINSINVAEIPDEIKTSSDTIPDEIKTNSAEIPGEVKTNVGKTPLTTLERIDVPVALSVQGDYPIIRQFIENLKNYRRSFVIDTVVFTSKEIRGNRKLEARITISMPYFGFNNSNKKL
ncbi:hypothetical protein KJ707_02520 [Patescibacteria group bacterium]|nr:hypothetical protein [Patescibacteria group bacterium]MBU1966758.1 hypothetical protein [Patescibacteria group bacterium]MBU2543411.1 hypothetical protein [Patescibacteria group bacterium]